MQNVRQQASGIEVPEKRLVRRRGHVQRVRAALLFYEQEADSRAVPREGAFPARVFEINPTPGRDSERRCAEENQIEKVTM